MNPNMHRANEFRANNLASSSQNFQSDFMPQPGHQSLFDIDITQQRHLLQNQQQQHHHHQQQQQHSQHTPPLSSSLPNNQWQQHILPMNGGQMHNTPPVPMMPQMPPQFNPMAWGAQMQPPAGFPTGLPGLGFNLLSQSIFQEAYAMSAPVEAADEPMLLSKLLASSRKGESYKDALNSLHGKNGHSATLWKDYYLDHKERLDAWITMCLEKEKENEREKANGGKSATSSDVARVKQQAAIKKPSPASFKREPSPHHIPPRVAISAPPVKKRGRPKKVEKARSTHSTPPIVLDQPAGSRRSTINSLTAPTAVFGNRLPAPHTEVRVPEPPSRSPTPPTVVIPHRGKGNKYTKEDGEYFIKFIGWRLRQDPNLNRNDLCELLEEKAPHHTAQSWASYWSGHHDLPDKILAAARGEDEVDEGKSASSAAGGSRTNRPFYKDATTTEEEEDSDGEEGEEEDGGEDDNDDDEDNGSPIPSFSEKDMGERGAPFTDADLHMTAKHIASFPNWEKVMSKDRWDAWGEKYPQRSAKSWAEYYRRNEAELLRLAKKFRKQNSSRDTQCARPTWLQAPKRKAEDATVSDDSAKRSRT